MLIKPQHHETIQLLSSNMYCLFGRINSFLSPGVYFRLFAEAGGAGRGATGNEAPPAGGPLKTPGLPAA